MKRNFALLALMATAILITGCNTVKGLGRDIESVGKAGDRAVN